MPNPYSGTALAAGYLGKAAGDVFGELSRGALEAYPIMQERQETEWEKADAAALGQIFREPDPQKLVQALSQFRPRSQHFASQYPTMVGKAGEEAQRRAAFGRLNAARVPTQVPYRTVAPGVTFESQSTAAPPNAGPSRPPFRDVPSPDFTATAFRPGPPRSLTDEEFVSRGLRDPVLSGEFEKLLQSIITGQYRKAVVESQIGAKHQDVQTQVTGREKVAGVEAASREKVAGIGATSRERVGAAHDKSREQVAKENREAMNARAAASLAETKRHHAASEEIRRAVAAGATAVRDAKDLQARVNVATRAHNEAIVRMQAEVLPYLNPFTKQPIPGAEKIVADLRSEIDTEVRAHEKWAKDLMQTPIRPPVPGEPGAIKPSPAYHDINKNASPPPHPTGKIHVHVKGKTGPGSTGWISPEFFDPNKYERIP